MRSLILSVVIVFIFTSCKDKSCPYQLATMCTPVDEKLYISYEIDGTKYTYYMGEAGGGFGSSSFNIPANEGKYAYCNVFRCVFEELYTGQSLLRFCGIFYLEFLNYDVSKDFIYKPPHEVIKVGTYRFSSPRNPITDNTLADTVFMKGVNLNLGDYSTSQLMEYYDYDADVIYTDVLNKADSYLKISSVEPMCDYYLVRGEFTTKLMKAVAQGETAKLVEVKDGKFQFLIR